MELIHLITIVLLITTTLNILIQVVSGLIDEREMFKKTGESFPKWTYSYTIVPQIIFIIGCIIVLNIPVMVLPFTLGNIISVTGIVYILFILCSGLGNFIVALIQKRDN